MGAGPGTRSAAFRLLLGAPWTHAATPPPYAGNGGAMRVAPAAALFRGDERAWIACAREQCRVTHRDPRAVAGAVAVAGATVLAARPGPLVPHDFLRRLAEWVEVEESGVAAAVRQARIPGSRSTRPRRPGGCTSRGWILPSPASGEAFPRSWCRACCGVFTRSCGAPRTGGKWYVSRSSPAATPIPWRPWPGASPAHVSGWGHSRRPSSGGWPTGRIGMRQPCWNWWRAASAWSSAGSLSVASTTLTAHYFNQFL